MTDVKPPIEATVAANTPAAALGFSNFGAAPLLMDIKLPMRVRMGRSQLNLRAITQLAAGSLVELECSVNDPVQIVVNDRVIAEGEIVIVEGNYGVRITQMAGGEPGVQSGTEPDLKKLSEKLT